MGTTRNENGEIFKFTESREIRFKNLKVEYGPKKSGKSWIKGAAFFAMLLSLSFSMWQCAKDDFEGETVGVCPEVVLTNPLDGAINVATDQIIAASFNEKMDPQTINESTFLLKQGSALIAGTVTFSDSTAYFDPAARLAANTIYTATITTGTRDLDGNALIKDSVWSFNTGNLPGYQVTLSSNPLIGGSTIGEGVYTLGTSVEISAESNPGYVFVNWTEGGNEVSINESITFVVESNRTLVANFNALPGFYTMLSSNPLIGGMTTGGGFYAPGASVVIEASVNPGYEFVNWTEGGNVVSVNESYTYIIGSTRTFVANFNALPVNNPNGVNLGSAGNFAVLGGSGISNTGVNTSITGDAGSFPTATMNGILSGNVNGVLYIVADPIVGLAKTDLTTAYNDAQGRSLNAISLPGQIGGLTLAPGLYVNSISSGISGTGKNAILTLDAGGNANAVWIFKMGSTLVTDAGTAVVLAGGAQAKNIYWSVGTSATLGTNSIFYGNILADQSVTLTTGATLYGRALTRIGAVTLDNNIIVKP